MRAVVLKGDFEVKDDCHPCLLPRHSPAICRHKVNLKEESKLTSSLLLDIGRRRRQTVPETPETHRCSLESDIYRALRKYKFPPSDPKSTHVPRQSIPSTTDVDDNS